MGIAKAILGLESGHLMRSPHPGTWGNPIERVA